MKRLKKIFGFLGRVRQKDLWAFLVCLAGLILAVGGILNYSKETIPLIRIYAGTAGLAFGILIIVVGVMYWTSNDSDFVD